MITTSRCFLGCWLLCLCLIGKQSFLTGGILVPIVHQQNQLLCNEVVKSISQTLPSSYTPKERADALCLQLDTLARKLLDQGLDLRAYSYEQTPDSPYLQFARIPLWQGAYDIQPEIPLTLFIYVWPPEHLAKQAAAINQPASDQDPLQNHYATNIHGHPLACALTVLKGTICQENYQALEGWPFRVVQKKDEEVMQVGMATFDDNQAPFIHRVLCRDQEPAITLHGYGAATAQIVREIFISNQENYSYPYILQENGKLTYLAW